MGWIGWEAIVNNGKSQVGVLISRGVGAVLGLAEQRGYFGGT
jgi:hypothetical protein